MKGDPGWQVVSELPGRERSEAGFCAFTGAQPARDGPTPEAAASIRSRPHHQQVLRWWLHGTISEH